MSDLDRNPEYRFSCDLAHLSQVRKKQACSAKKTVENLEEEVLDIISTKALIRLSNCAS